MTRGEASGPVTAHGPAGGGDRQIASEDAEIVERHRNVRSGSRRRLPGTMPPSVTPPCAARLPLALSRAENSRIVSRSRSPTISSLHIVQHRAGREILVTAVRDSQPPAGGGRGNGAVHRAIERETAGDPVLAERQQIGEVRDLAAAAAPVTPAARCGGTATAKRLRIERQRGRAGEAQARRPWSRRPARSDRCRGRSSSRRDRARAPAAAPALAAARRSERPDRLNRPRGAASGPSIAASKAMTPPASRIARRAGRSRRPAGLAPRAAATRCRRAAPRSPVIRPRPNDAASPVSARSSPRRVIVSGRFSRKRSGPSAPSSRARRSSIAPVRAANSAAAVRRQGQLLDDLALRLGAKPEIGPASGRRASAVAFDSPPDAKPTPVRFARALP